MMNFYFSHKYFDYEAANLFRIFYPYTKFTVVSEYSDEVNFSIIDKETQAEITLDINQNCISEKIDFEADLTEKDKEYIITSRVYNLLSEVSGYTPKWGMLTGIHPVKLFSNYVENYSLDYAEKHFLNNFFVSQEKVDICKEMHLLQAPYVKKVAKEFSLYVSIPFCPSRCSYCSFVSQSVEKSKNLIRPYLDLLVKELEHTAKKVKEKQLILKTIYIGGGTPTTLNAEELEILISTIKNSFDLSKCTEFTVEAGRCDTINADKLNVIKKLGIDRISINPQSLNDEVLVKIGRKHSAQDVIDTYEISKNIGITDINMDLIAGLDGDDYESFCKTIDEVIELNPSNVTVHALALKRSATIFNEENIEAYHGRNDEVINMIDYSIKKLMEADYVPYYLYRQNRMAGNAENIGWAKKGSICVYNIFSMDESHTVIACGAGGVSKIVDPNSNRLERVFNFKYAYEYINRFDEIIARKDEVVNLYEQFCERIH